MDIKELGKLTLNNMKMQKVALETSLDLLNKQIEIIEKDLREEK